MIGGQFLRAVRRLQLHRLRTIGMRSFTALLTKDGTRLVLTDNCPYGVRRDAVALHPRLNEEPFRRLDW
jgi:hypothetical protein